MSLNPEWITFFMAKQWPVLLQFARLTVTSKELITSASDNFPSTAEIYKH